MLTVQIRTQEEPKREQVAKPTSTSADGTDKARTVRKTASPEGRPQRSLPLRQRQEVQEVLRPRRRGRTERRLRAKRKTIQGFGPEIPRGKDVILLETRYCRIAQRGQIHFV